MTLKPLVHVQFLAPALSSLRRSPAFSIAAFALLTMGVGSNAALYSVIDAVLLRPLPYVDSERVVRVAHIHSSKGATPNDFSPPDYSDLEDYNRSHRVFSQLGAYAWHSELSGMNLIAQGHPVQVQAAAVSGGFFATLGLEAMLGRTLMPTDVADAAHVVVISSRIWHRRFGGTPEIVGRTVTLNGRPFILVGVLPPRFDFPSLEVDVWIPLSLITDDVIPRARGLRWLEVIGRLAPGVGNDEATAALDLLFAGLARTYPDSNVGWEESVVIPLPKLVVGRVRTTLLAAQGLGLLLMLTSCGGLTHLMLGRLSRRQHEFAICQAIGASRKQLVCQSLAEGSVIGLLGCAGGLGVASCGVAALSNLAEGQIPRMNEVHLNVRVLAVTLTVSLLTAILAEVAPMILTARIAGRESLRSGYDRGLLDLTRGPVRSLLVVFAVASAIILLVVSTLLMRSLHRLLKIDPGFRAENVLSLSVRMDPLRYPDAESRGAFRRDVLQRIKKLPGVVAVGGSKTQLMAGGGEPFVLSVGRRKITPTSGAFFVTPGYFETLKISLLAGRTLSDADSSESNLGAIVNRGLAEQLWPAGDAVGKMIALGSTNLSVVGVVADVRNDSLAEGPGGAIYLPIRYFSRPTLRVFVRTEARESMLYAEAVRQAIWEVDPLQPIGDVVPLGEVLAAGTARARLSASLALSFALLTSFLSIVLVYGISSYTADSRTHEVAVRAALGALQSEVVLRILGQGAKPAGVGVALGLSGALIAGRVMESLLFEIEPADPMSLVIAPLTLFVATLAAGFIPALRVTRLPLTEVLGLNRRRVW